MVWRRPAWELQEACGWAGLFTREGTLVGLWGWDCGKQPRLETVLEGPPGPPSGVEKWGQSMCIQ